MYYNYYCILCVFVVLDYEQYYTETIEETIKIQDYCTKHYQSLQDIVKE